jgi:hypothetical protein
MAANRVTVSVTLPNPAVQSVVVEQWRRRTKGAGGDRTPEKIPGSPTTPMTRLDADGTEWFTDPFNLHNSGGAAFRRFLRIRAFDGMGMTGNTVALVGLPPRRFPKQRASK